MSNNAPIGVFDSGIGGLTVLKELIQLMPQENFIYFGDTGRAPYGCRPKEEITQFMRQILAFFQSRQIKMAVVACNAMTTVGLEQVRREMPFPLVGVNNGAVAALKLSRKHRIGVIATKATIDSEKHLHAIQALDGKAFIYPQACPKFVPLIEQEKVAGPEVKAAITEYMLPMKEAGVDAVILACTHYPFINQAIEAVVGKDMLLIDPAKETAAEAFRILETSGELASQKEGSVQICFSAEVERARRMTRLMMDIENVSFRQIHLEEYVSNE